MKSVRVSVVMAVFNGGNALAESAQSAITQMSADDEIVIVDDGSTDESVEHLSATTREDPRIKLIRQRNEGLTVALARGCGAARGQYVARQDCGDVSLPGRLLRQVELLERDASLAFCSVGTRYTTVSGESLYETLGELRHASSPVWILDDECQWGVRAGPTHHGAVMFRRDAYERVGGYRADFYYGQDWDLWYRLAEIGKFQLVPEVLYEARLGERDISLTNRARQEMIGRESLRAMRLRRQGLSEEPALAAARLIRPGNAAQLPQPVPGAGAYFLGEALRRNGNIKAARLYLRRALAARPTNFRAWARLVQCYLR